MTKNEIVNILKLIDRNISRDFNYDVKTKAFVREQIDVTIENIQLYNNDDDAKTYLEDEIARILYLVATKGSI